LNSDISLFLIFNFSFNRNNSHKMNQQNFPLTVFYDASCPVCRLEMHALRERDLALHAQEPQLHLVDMSAPGFDPTPYGASLAQMNALIHAVQPDGSLVVGVDVFRLAYGAVGMGRWVAPVGWRWLRPAVDAAYALFAKNRYGISRFFSPLVLWIERRRLEKAAQRSLVASQACQGLVSGESCEVSSPAQERSPV
jgi:predicted DCC family thiol-disulfide oxidoreductase YuxK